MERLTKAELRALLESIKECYSICDRQSFKQRVLSRLSKIVSTASISHNGIHPRRHPRNVCETHSSRVYHTSKRIVRQRSQLSSLDSSVKAAGLREERPAKIKPQSPARCGLSSRLKSYIGCHRERQTRISV